MNPPVNPMFAKFDQALGKTSPTVNSAGSPNKSRADEIRSLAAQNQPAETFMGATLTDAGSRAKQDIQNTGSNISAMYNGTGAYANKNDTLGILERGTGIVSEAAGAPLKIASEALPEPVRAGIGKVGEGVGSAIGYLGDKIGNIKALQDWTLAHPEAAKNLEEIAGTAANMGNIAGNILAAEGVKAGVPKALDATGSLAGKVGDAVSSVKGAVTELPKNDLQVISEKISPKPTAKEAKLALDQGRLIKGNDPTLFKSGTPDKIAASDQQLKSSMTVKRLIPDAAKMDEPTLHSALDSKISETAKSLEPQMKSTPIKPETVQKITDEWESAKKSQIENADATEEPNIIKAQKKFESRLQKSGSENMNDLWNTAKEYDASIPDNVKQANSLSSESLQNKKSIWMQNRSILRNAINDSESGLGKTSRQAFSDMKDMYEAQNGIMTKAKVDTKLAPSKVSQALNSRTGKIVKGVVKYGVGAELVKKGLGL